MRGVEDSSAIGRDCRILAADVGGKVSLQELARPRLSFPFGVTCCYCALLSALKAMNLKKARDSGERALTWAALNSNDVMMNAL